MIEESAGMEKGVLIDLYRHLTFAHFIGTEGKRAREELDRNYPSQGLFDPMRAPSGDYTAAQGSASEMIQANIERNDQLDDEVRLILESLLVRLISEGLLDPPGTPTVRELAKPAPDSAAAQGPRVFFDGTDDEISDYLAGTFATPAFRLVGNEIELKLPEVGKDRRPRPTGETIVTRLSAPREWTIQAPERGSLWHVVAEGADSTLCTVDLRTWQGTPRVDPDHAVTCPWCRARILAIEIAAPPGEYAGQAPDARHVLKQLVGQTIHTVGQAKPNEVLRVEGDNVVVATSKSPGGEPVPIQSVQNALDQLYREGNLLLDVGTTGFRSAFIGAMLATIPEIEVKTRPRRAALRLDLGERLS